MVSPGDALFGAGAIGLVLLVVALMLWPLLLVVAVWRVGTGTLGTAIALRAPPGNSGEEAAAGPRAGRINGKVSVPGWMMAMVVASFVLTILQAMFLFPMWTWWFNHY